MKKMGRRAVLAGTLAAPAIAPGVVQGQDAPATLRDLARRATIYLFPVYEMYRTRWQATVNEANPQRQKFNRFRHLAQLADHRSRAVTTPNNDTFYSSAWLDLSLEPMFLTVPPVGDLYYSYAFLDLFTNNFAYLSHRLHGGQPPPHMIVGPGMDGDAPSEVKLLRAPTNSVWLIGRILVEGPEEVDRVRTLQARVLLETPDMRNERRILETRELMRQRTVPPPEPVADWPAPNREDPFDLFVVGARALGESPLSERDRAMFETLAPLKLRPGRKFDLRAFSETEQRAIRAGIEQGHAEIRAVSSRPGKMIDGWSYGRRHLGNFGEDYLYRAATALVGLGALEPAEAVYMTCNSDWADGRCRAPTATNSPSRSTVCPPPAPSGRLPCMKCHPTAAPSSSTIRSAATPSATARGACGKRRTDRSLCICSTIDRRMRTRPTGCPRRPDRCAWCCAPTNPRSR